MENESAATVAAASVEQTAPIPSSLPLAPAEAKESANRASLSLALTDEEEKKKVLSQKRLHLIDLWTDLVSRHQQHRSTVNRLNEQEKAPEHYRTLLINQRQRHHLSTDYTIRAVILRQFQLALIEKQLVVVDRTIELNRVPVAHLRRALYQSTKAQELILDKATDLREELVRENALY